MSDYGPYAVVREVTSRAEILEGSRDEMDRFTDVCIEESQNVCPVDTGRLLETIRKEEEGLDWIIIAGGIVVRGKLVHYAEVVHQGGGDGANAVGRPFLDWGIEAAISKFEVEQEQRQYRSYNPISYASDPFTGETISNWRIFERYSAGPSVRGFGDTLIGRVPAGTPGGRGGQFFSLEPYKR